ncbi:MAG TPA: hypothetical protein PLX89_26235, partial [Verrucomicrobiota bacterium]|nr:hypothetical protein [Verrucomicrobiota bacterium]
IAEGDPSGRDFWSSPDTERVTVLRSNSLPWVDGKDYRFTLRFTAGDFTIRVWDGDTPIETWTVNDSKFTQGRFGYFVNSLQDVRFGEVLVGEIAPLRIVEFNRLYPTSSLRWSGGIPPYQLEQRPRFEAGQWQRDSTLRWLRSASEVDPDDMMFYQTISIGDP